MRWLLTLIPFTICFLSCRTKIETAEVTASLQLIIPDTTNNRRAHRDFEDLNYRSKLENKLGLSNLTKGVDSLEIRLWYDFSFSISKELYILKFQDSTCLISYFRVFPRNIDYNDEKRNRDWDPYEEPSVDSFVSKSILLNNDYIKNLHTDSIWLLKSQSELKISDNIGFTDCDSYILEIADKKRFKYLRHHCATSYYEKTKLTEILTYMDYCWRITSLARKFDVIVPYHFD